MGAKKAKKKAKKKLRQYTEDAIADLDALLADMRARAELQSAELAIASARVRSEAERAGAQLREQLAQAEASGHEALADARSTIGASVETAEASVRNLADETGTRMRAAFVELEARRDDVTGALEQARVAATTTAADAEEQVKGHVERVEREVERALARLDDLWGQLDVETERIAERTRALDDAQATAVRELEEHGYALRAQMEPLFVPPPIMNAPIDAPPSDETTPAFECEEVPTWEPTNSDVTPEEIPTQDVTPEEIPSEETTRVDSLSWSAASEAVGVGTVQPVAEAPVVAEPVAAEVGWPPPAGELDEPAATAETFGPPPDHGQHGPGAESVAFRTSRARLHASVAHLARTAADGWVHVEIVNDASQGAAGLALRLTVRDVVGTWEYHNVRGQASSGARPQVTVDVKELLRALELDRYSDDRFELLLGDDLTIGTTLVPGRTTTTAMPIGQRRKVERIELPTTSRGDLTVDTLLGRLVIPSRVTSSLRSRRALDVDLVAIDDRPCLVAQVPGPNPDVSATVITPLEPDAVAHESAIAERRASDDSPVSQLVGALSARSSPDELADIVANGVGYARRRAAAHPALPTEVIIELLHDGTEAIRSAAAANPSIPHAAIEDAVKDDAASVRAAVAVNPNVPPTLLFQLVRDDSVDVRAGAARNPSIPPEMLGSLVDDQEAEVRAAVAAHESCPVEQLAVLAADAFPSVCANVARNPNCPPELLEDLLGTVPEVVLANPRTPEHVLVAGSQIASAQLRAAVAANPSTPSRELQNLARDNDPAVVRAVISNPSAPANVQRRALRRSERVKTGWEPEPDVVGASRRHD